MKEGPFLGKRLVQALASLGLGLLGLGLGLGLGYIFKYNSM
jgi:hypothetical protein